MIAKFLRTDFVICSHSREGETPSYSRINKVISHTNAAVAFQTNPKVSVCLMRRI